MGATTTEGTGFGDGIIGSKGPDGGSRNIYKSANEATILPQLVRIGTYFLPSVAIHRITFDVPLDAPDTDFIIFMSSTGVGGFNKPIITARNNNADGNFESFDLTIGATPNTLTFLVYSIGTTGFQQTI